VVRPSGRIALLEVATPANRLLRAGHGAYFGTVVPRIGGLLSDPAAYRYLPRSVAYLPPTASSSRRSRPRLHGGAPRPAHGRSQPAPLATRVG
jgi:ubiquinone/menaquinone biosynthesis C-methylase UbiE